MKECMIPYCIMRPRDVFDVDVDVDESLQGLVCQLEDFTRVSGLQRGSVICSIPFDCWQLIS
jgi:hypothetical protein